MLCAADDDGKWSLPMLAEVLPAPVARQGLAKLWETNVERLRLEVKHNNP